MRFRANRSYKPFAVTTLLVLSLVALLWAETGQDHSDTIDRNAFHIPPYLQNASPDGITIMWETKRPTRSELEYWESSKGEDAGLKVADDAEVKIHRIRIKRLKPDTQYRYRLQCGDEVRQADFTTAPAKSRPIRFAVFGDSRFWKDYWQTTPLPQHLLSRKPEFALHMGDLVSNGQKYGEWPAHFARFESVSSRVPIFPVRGNHERNPSEDPQNDWFGKYHELPGGEPYSSFDWGNSHFSIVSYTHISKCASFLDRDLGATKKKWKFVAFHYPVYCTGYSSPSDERKVSGNAELEAIFDRHRVDMVFSGHTHIYERSFPLREGKRNDRNGTVYLVQGGAVGGNYPDWWTATIARELSFPHYTLVEVNDDRIELRSYGLAKGDNNKGHAAKIIEIDHYVKWRDKELPEKILAPLRDKSGAEFLRTIENLGAMCYSPAAQPLLGYLRNENVEIQRATALALERIASPAVSERLLPFLQHPDLVVRRRVARALEAAMLPEIGEKVARESLNPAQDSQVRIRLLGALLHHAPEVASRTAAKALAAGDEAVRDRATHLVKSLRRTGSGS